MVELVSLLNGCWWMNRIGERERRRRWVPWPRSKVKLAAFKASSLATSTASEMAVDPNELYDQLMRQTSASDDIKVQFSSIYHRTSSAGILRDPSGSSGFFWDLLDSLGLFWTLLSSCGIFCDLGTWDLLGFTLGYPGLGLGSNSGYFLGDLGCPWTHEDVVQHPLKSCGMLHFSGFFYLGCLGILWDILGSSGIFWDLLGSFGIFWDLLGSSGILLGVLFSPLMLWDVLGCLLGCVGISRDGLGSLSGYLLGDLGCPWMHGDVIQDPLESCGMPHFSVLFYSGWLRILWDLFGMLSGYLGMSCNPLRSNSGWSAASLRGFLKIRQHLKMLSINGLTD